LIWIKGVWDRHFIPAVSFEIFIDQQLYAVQLKSKIHQDTIVALLNSTYFAIFQELIGRVTFGEGILWIAVYEPMQLQIPDPRKITNDVLVKLIKTFSKLKQREISTVFEEIGASSPEEVSPDKVKPDRRELDKIVMGEILGLTEEEQLEVYRAVVELVRSRIEKAKSVQKGRKVGELDINGLVDSVLKEVEKLYGIQTKKFPEDYIDECSCRVIEVPRGSRVESGYDLEGPYVDIDGEKLRCSSIYEAKFIEYALLAGRNRIPIPEDENVLKRAVEERTKILSGARVKVEEFLNEVIADRKLREKVRFEVFRRLGV